MVNSAQHIAFYGNTICHTGNDGLSFVNDVVDSTVSGNLIYDTAGSAFLLGHPQHVYIGDKGSNYGAFSEKEKYDVGVEGACKRIKLTNNSISDTSLMFWGDAGVMVFLAEEFEMKYNHLQNTPYSGLSLGWGWWNMDGSNGAVVPGVPMETTKNNTIMYNTFKIPLQSWVMPERSIHLVTCRGQRSAKTISGVLAHRELILIISEGFMLTKGPSTYTERKCH